MESVLPSGRRNEMTRELFHFVTLGIWLTMVAVVIAAFRQRDR
jgi:hypothetical protein